MSVLLPHRWRNGLTVSVTGKNVRVDRWFEPPSGQSKDFRIGIVASCQ